MVIPAVVALLLLALFVAPARVGGFSLAPNVGFLMALILASTYPAAWPRGFAFLFGLLQDVLFGTPLGAQALVMLLLVGWAQGQGKRQALSPFHLRWLEAAAALLISHALLWGTYRFTGQTPPAMVRLLGAGVMSAIWFPLFYAPIHRLLQWMPGAK